MTVAVGEVRRPVGNDRVERRGRRQPAGERVHRPAAATYPREFGVVRRVLGDAPEVAVGGVIGGQVARDHVEACVVRVDVAVLEAGGDEATRRVDFDGVGRGERVRTDCRDDAVLDEEWFFDDSGGGEDVASGDQQAVGHGVSPRWVW
jgi:hypothetical protein